jgi:hypothetical protein
VNKGIGGGWWVRINEKVNKIDLNQRYGVWYFYLIC